MNHLKRIAVATGIGLALIAGTAATTGATWNNQTLSYDHKWYTVHDHTYGTNISFKDYSFNDDKLLVPKGHCVQLWEAVGVNTRTVCATKTATKWAPIRNVTWTWVKTTK